MFWRGHANQNQVATGISKTTHSQDLQGGGSYEAFESKYNQKLGAHLRISAAAGKSPGAIFCARFSNRQAEADSLSVRSCIETHALILSRDLL
jgi:hypothetical protein